MRYLYEHELYKQDISTVLKCPCDWSKLKERTVLISGGTGLIGTVLIDMFCLLNENYNLGIKILVVSRTADKFNQFFSGRDNVFFVQQDVSKTFTVTDKLDYIIHLASNTHPQSYATQPISTVTTNILGTLNLFELAKNNPGSRVLLLSSVEIYGEDKDHNIEKFTESDFGYIDCNTVRAGYNESKRCSEALACAYNSECGVDFVIARLCRCYGPTLLKSDTKALSQFIFHSMKSEDIVLKSEGLQNYSYLYASDACTALITILLKGKTTEAYNISDSESDILLKDLAQICAKVGKSKVVFDLPSKEESKGYSVATKALLDSSKLKTLGWKACYNISEGIKRTIKILNEK